MPDDTQSSTATVESDGPTPVEVVDDSRVKRVKNTNLVLVHGCKVNYDLPVTEVVAGQPKNNRPDLSRFPQSRWSGDNTGTVEEVTIPIVWAQKIFSAQEGRELLGDHGFGLPAELVALRDESVLTTLHKMGIDYIVAIGRNDRELWREPLEWGGRFRPVSLCTRPDLIGDGVSFPSVRFGFSTTSCAAFALVGAPQFPHK